MYAIRLPSSSSSWHKRTSWSWIDNIHLSIFININCLIKFSCTQGCIQNLQTGVAVSKHFCYFYFSLKNSNNFTPAQWIAWLAWLPKIRQKIKIKIHIFIFIFWRILGGQASHAIHPPESALVHQQESPSPRILFLPVCSYLAQDMSTWSVRSTKPVISWSHVLNSLYKTFLNGRNKIRKENET